MITKEHKKHSHIAKPPCGNYCKNEWAIVGTQCSLIQGLADEVIKALSVQYKCAYADAQHPTHNTEGDMPKLPLNKAVVEYTNRQYDHQFNIS